MFPQDKLLSKGLCRKYIHTRTENEVEPGSEADWCCDKMSYEKLFDFFHDLFKPPLTLYFYTFENE